MFFLLYTVDDGTGVINCLCWKNDLFKEKVDSNQGKFATFFEIVNFIMSLFESNHCLTIETVFSVSFCVIASRF